MAKPKKPLPKKGKKSVAWKMDTAILKRLASVEDLDLAGYRNTEIGRALQVSEATIRRDKKRIAELWRTDATESIRDLRLRSVAQYKRMQRLADNQFRSKFAEGGETGSASEAAALLRIQIEAEKEIAKLQGTPQAPKQIIELERGDDDVQYLSSEALINRAANLRAMALELLETPEDDE
jgi:hypothetical protein